MLRLSEHAAHGDLILVYMYTQLLQHLETSLLMEFIAMRKREETMLIKVFAYLKDKAANTTTAVVLIGLERITPTLHGGVRGV